MPPARHHPRCLHSLLCLPVGFLGGITVASVVGIGGLAHFTWHRQLLAVSGLVGRGLLAKITTCLLILGEASLPIYLMAQHSLRVLQRSIFQDVMQGAKTLFGAAEHQQPRAHDICAGAAVTGLTSLASAQHNGQLRTFLSRLSRVELLPSSPTVCPTAGQASHGQAVLTVTNAPAGALPITDLLPRDIL